MLEKELQRGRSEFEAAGRVWEGKEKGLGQAGDAEGGRF